MVAAPSYTSINWISLVGIMFNSAILDNTPFTTTAGFERDGLGIRAVQGSLSPRGPVPTTALSA